MDSGGTAGGAPVTGGTSLGAAAVLLAASAILSIVLGYGRDMVLASIVGVGSESDAYFAAFMIPDLLNYLLAGGALAIAFMPLYNRVRSARGEAAGDRLFATTLGNVAGLVVLVTAGLWFWTEDIIARGFPGFDAETQALTVELTRIVLPAQVFFITGGVMRSALMAHGSFSAQAAAPVLYNAFVIAGGLAMGRVEGFAWGVLLGAFVGAFCIPAAQLVGQGRLRIRLAPRDADFRTYLWLALPLMLGLSLTTVDEWYEKWFGHTLGEGSVAALSYARKLMRAPVTVVGQAVAAAALPTLSLLWSRGETEELDRIFSRTLRESVAVAVLAAAALFAFAPEVVELLYRHGRFTAEDAQHVSSILRVLTLAVPAFVAQQVGVRAFYAREDTWRPMLLGTALALAVIPLYAMLAQRSGTVGLAAAGAMALTANGLATLIWARVRYGAPSLRTLGATVLRSAVVATAAVLVSTQVAGGRTGSVGALVDLLVGGAVFAAVSAVGVALIGDAAMREPVGRIAGRLRRVVRRAPTSNP